MKSGILSEHTPIWQLILRLVGDAFLVRFPFIRRTQKANALLGIDEYNILERMVFLFAAIVDFLLVPVFRSRYRPFDAVLAKKGGASGSAGVVSARN